MIYKNDKKCIDLGDEERLTYHQKYSWKPMKEVYRWCHKMQSRKKVEPNSGLGKSIEYFLKHWKRLTQFLKVPGCPLDNSECERLIKTAIRHRKNSLFYKTGFGALIGDIFMSIIQTCRNIGTDPFRYLVELQKKSSSVFKNPEKWLPWNFELNFV